MNRAPAAWMRGRRYRYGDSNAGSARAGRWGGQSFGRFSKTTGHATRSPCFKDSPTASQPSASELVKSVRGQGFGFLLELPGLVEGDDHVLPLLHSAIIRATDGARRSLGAVSAPLGPKNPGRQRFRCLTGSFQGRRRQSPSSRFPVAIWTASLL